jgi:hypothetical protein
VERKAPAYPKMRQATVYAVTKMYLKWQPASAEAAVGGVAVEDELAKAGGVAAGGVAADGKAMTDGGRRGDENRNPRPSIRVSTRENPNFASRKGKSARGIQSPCA